MDAKAISDRPGIHGGFSGFSTNSWTILLSSTCITPKSLASSSETSRQPIVKSAF